MTGPAGTVRTFSVLVPAFDEGRNIGGLLDDVFAQDPGGSLSLEKVIVVSDHSTDDTEDIARERARSDHRLELVVNPERKGKASCLNTGMRLVESDYLVLLDADIRLEGPLTLRKLLEGAGEDTGLLGGRPIPGGDCRGLAPMIFGCGDILRTYIQKNFRGGRNIYSAHGRILGLARSLYTDLEIPRLDSGSRVLSTDQFIYYACLRAGLEFEFRPEAVVLFTLPASITDYMHQTVRFMYSAVNTREYFGDRGYSSEFHVPMRVKAGAMLSLFAGKPLGALAWLAYRAASKALYLFKRYVLKQEEAATWKISPSTKRGVRTSGR